MKTRVSLKYFVSYCRTKIQENNKNPFGESLGFFISSCFHFFLFSFLRVFISSCFCFFIFSFPHVFVSSEIFVVDCICSLHCFFTVCQVPRFCVVTASATDLRERFLPCTLSCFYQGFPRVGSSVFKIAKLPTEV